MARAECESLKPHNERWSCFERVLQEVPEYTSWRSAIREIARAVWNVEEIQARIEKRPPPQAPPWLPPARPKRGFDRLSECGDETTHHLTRVKCFDRELRAAIGEEPAYIGDDPGSRRQYDELRTTYAKLDASDAQLDALFHPKPVVVFGMTLGKPFTVPPCVIGTDGLAGRTSCWREAEFSLLGRQVHLSASNTPLWVKHFAAVDVEVISGNLERVHISTLGLGFQDLVIGALKDKFGPPQSAGTTIKQNAFGANFQVATLGWKIGSVTIVFDGGDLDEGLVILSTEKSQYLQKAAARLRKNF